MTKILVLTGIKREYMDYDRRSKEPFKEINYEHIIRNKKEFLVSYDDVSFHNVEVRDATPEEV